VENNVESNSDGEMEKVGDETNNIEVENNFEDKNDEDESNDVQARNICEAVKDLITMDYVHLIIISN